MEDIAKEVALELPFLRNQKRLCQIWNFANFVRRERRARRQTMLRTFQVISRFELPRAPSRKAMDPMDRANWFETEGCLSSSPGESFAGSGAEFVVSQAERSPLQCFATGCLNDGVVSRLYNRVNQNGMEYVLRIRRLDHIATEVSRELPFLRTQKGMSQVASFIEFIHLPRKRLSKSLELARLALPRGPVV